MRRAISFVLTICMLVCMVPFTFDDGNSYAAASVMIIRSMSDMSPLSGTYYKNDGEGELTATDADEHNYNLKFVPDENKLILKDLTLTNAAIMMTLTSDEDIIIEVEGDNSISYRTYGIAIAKMDGYGPVEGGKLIITGSGILSIELTEEESLVDSQNDFAAIYSTADVVIGGSVNLKTVGACDPNQNYGVTISSSSCIPKRTYGIYSMLGSVTLQDSSDTEAKGLYSINNDSSVASYGIWAKTGVTVTDDARLTAISGNTSTGATVGDSISQAIHVEDGDFVAGGHADVTAESGNAASSGSNVFACGIYAKNNISIEVSAYVRAFAGDAETAGDRNCRSVGVYTQNGNVTVAAIAGLLVRSSDANFITTNGSPSNDPLSCGINAGASGDINIYGTVYTSAGRAIYTGSEPGVEPESYGIYAHNITLAGDHEKLVATTYASGESMLVAGSEGTSGGSLNRSFGIRTTGDFTAADASVNAEAMFVVDGSDLTLTNSRLRMSLGSRGISNAGITASNPAQLNITAEDSLIWVQAEGNADSFSGIDANNLTVSGGSLFCDMSNLACAGNQYGVKCANNFTAEWTGTEIELGNAGGNSTLIKSGGVTRIADNGYARLTAGNAGGDNIGIDCNCFTADSTDVHITLGTAGGNATGIKTPGAAFNTKDNYIEINTSSAAAAVGIDAASLTGRGTGVNAIEITMLGDVGTATALSTGAVTLDNYCFISNSSEAVGTGEMTAIDCSGDLNLTNGAEIFVNVGSTPGDNYGVKCREVNSENSRLETVMYSVSGTGIGTKAANINATDSLVVSSFYSYTGANFGVAKGIEASALNVTGGTLRVDMSLSAADGDNTGIVCNTFAANSVDGSITGGTGNSSYGIKAAGDVTIDSNNTMFTFEIGNGANASVGIDAGGNILVSAGALFEPNTYGTAPENCRVARLGAGTFTLAEGLHWATAAGIASTNGAYTFSADENYLIASTSAIVISSPSHHHSGGSGSVGTDDSKTVVKESTDGSKTTIKTDANGNLLSVEAAVSEKAVANATAKGKPVKIDASVKAASSASEAVPVSVGLPKSVTPQNPVAVEIPVENMTSGTVAVMVYGDGTEEIIKTSVAGEDGIVMMLDGSATVKVIDNSKSFSDVKGSEWFAGNVAWAASREIMNGIGGGIFDAGSLTNRGMISQILFNLEGARATAAQTIIATERFGDVSSNNWFAGSVGWLIANDIAQGQGSDFGAADPVTREQLAVMYYNYANFKGFKMNARGDVAKFADSADVSSWAEEALSWAVGMGLIQGTLLDDGSIALDPQGSSTRAMVAAITQRFCEKLF